MTRRPRVVVFGIRGLDDVEGGIETHARELYPRLAALGLDVTVLVRRRYAGPTDSWARRGVRVLPLWSPHGRGIEAFGHAVLCVLYSLVVRPDAVHIHGIGPGVFASVLRAAGIRVVVTHHGQDYDATKWGPVARASLRYGERRAIRDADVLITVSHSIAGAVEGLHGSGGVVIGNGLPARGVVATATPSDLSAELQGRDYVLVVGRLTAHKRVLDVVEALARPSLAHLTLVVCGDTGTEDPYAKAVERAGRLNPQVVLAGHVGSADLARLYRGARCTVMASSYEGQPLALLEAIAAGCPVLASDIPGHLEVGLAPFQYFALGDVEQLAARLDTLLRMPIAVSTAAQSRCLEQERFDWDHIARATAAVLTGRGDIDKEAPRLSDSEAGHQWVGGRA